MRLYVKYVIEQNTTSEEIQTDHAKHLLTGIVTSLPLLVFFPPGLSNSVVILLRSGQWLQVPM